MIKVFYYWTADGEGELCALDKIVLDRDEVCYHCDQTIPAGSPAVSLRPIDDHYILHRDCALEGCNLRPAEHGMRRRLIEFLEDCL